MKPPQKSIARYILTLHFHRDYMPIGTNGMITQIENFLEDVGKLARSDGKNFFAEYHLVQGIEGYHAHVLSNWLPTSRYRKRGASKTTPHIKRNAILALMRDHLFLDQNPTESIKRITHHSSRVKSYVRNQNIKGQKAICSGTYQSVNFVPIYTEYKINPYYSRQFFDASNGSQKRGCISKLLLISYAIIATSVMISSIFHIIS